MFFELPLSDVTVVDGEKSPRLLRGGHACRRGHVVRRHVVRGAQSARRHRVVAENGASQPLTLDHSFVQRTLYDKPSAPRGPLELSDVARSSGKLSWLAPTSNGGAEIVAYVFERPEHLSPTWTHVARVRPQTRRPTTKSASASKTSRFARPTAVRSFSRPTADGHGDNQNSTCPVAQSLCTMPAVTFSIRFRTGH